MIYFHHAMFMGVLICAFFAGALNAGRADMLRQREATLLLTMTVEQLTTIDVEEI